MPKATALWLIDNTALTFQQIADFTRLHLLEVQALADGEADHALAPLDPIAQGQLDLENLKKAENDPNVPLVLIIPKDELSTKKRKKGKYTPLSRRKNKPDAIAWLVKYHPELTDAQIIQLIGTTKNTIEAIRQKTHWNMEQIKPRNPVVLELCLQKDLDRVVTQSQDTPKEKS